MSQTTPPADETPDAAPRGAATPPQANDADSAQQTAGSAVPPAPPLHRRPLFWSLLFLVLLLALLGWHIYRQWQTARELEARQQAELAAVRERNDALEAYLKMLRDLLAQDPCVIKENCPPCRRPRRAFPACRSCCPAIPLNRPLRRAAMPRRNRHRLLCRPPSLPGRK